MAALISETLIRAAERRHGMRHDYLREIRRASLGAFIKFAMFMPFARQRRKLSVAAQAVAQIATVLTEDCGPCLRIGVVEAELSGVDPDIIAAAVAGRVEALPGDLADVYRFAQAVATRRLEAEPLRERLEERLGQAALVDLAFVIAGTRVYPALKRALGQGAVCEPVTVADRRVAAAVPAE